MNNTYQLPMYIKATIVLIGLCLLTYVLWLGQAIILPILYAYIFSVIINPLVIFLEKKMPRILSITIAVVIAIAIVAMLVFALGSEFMHFSSALPGFEQKVISLKDQAINSIADKTGMETYKVNEKLNQLQSGNDSFLGKTLITMWGVGIAILLLPIYVFLMLYYLPLFIEFIRRLFPKERHESVGEILISIRVITQAYLTGLLIKVVIVAVLDSLGLFALGIQYALLLGIITALISLIPYIGLILSAIPPVLIALITKDANSALMVFALFAVMQFIDNHYIMPFLVASKIKINAMIAILALLLFGALWGIPGMFLSIPITGIIKIIFDRIDSLKPWGYLMGDDIPPVKLIDFFFKKQRKKINTQIETSASFKKI